VNIIRTMDDAERAARAMSASGFFSDTKQASQAIVKILAGQELGFGPFASMTGVAIIQGKPTVGANLMAAAVKRTGKYNYRVTKLSDVECEITFFEGGQEAGKSSFTMADAEKAGLKTKDNWKKYPRNMLFARALSNGQRWHAPDVFNGATVYTPDELGATVDEEGNAVEGVTQPQPDNIGSMTIEEARDTIIKTSKGDKRLGDMTLEELDKVIEKSIMMEKVVAAQIVKAHDYQMEDTPEGSKTPEGQLL
jgi:hypothetical protein